MSCLNWYEAEVTKLADITEVMESTTTCPCGLPMLSNESRWVLDWSRFVTKSGCHSVCFYDRQARTQSTMVSLYSGFPSMSHICNCCAKSTQEHASRWWQEHYNFECRSLKLVVYNIWKKGKNMIDKYYSYVFIKKYTWHILSSLPAWEAKFEGRETNNSIWMEQITCCLCRWQ